ncbi:response regulator [Caulobacter hibisci]|uniref:Response regulator n=1 Tax=Caulobacter hibisci TaxID=2035993 RepID=A0ABS0SWW6_9CAUL|nr:response regulator [Caulobacter hibisci]MBI1684078.1 response regulator [Caulobacter hibisci]
MAARIPVVLIVEDEPLVRELALAALEEVGAAVLQAANAQEAMEVLRGRSDVGVVFTDIDMPGPFDGLGLARLVHRQWPAIRLVITSGAGLAEPLPVNGRYLQKPYSLQHMTDAVTLLPDAR